MALPVRASPAGLVVAMAAPTDRHAVAELCRVVEGEVLPAVARVSELLDALARAYPSGAPPRIATRPSSEPPVLELVQAHRKKELAAVEGYLGSTRGAERVEARARRTAARDGGGRAVRAARPPQAAPRRRSPR
ncbi:MAG: hypothetical protein M5U28_53450 [Sandaracinaceae bacterium]|nr:hypothetical protein [Sandaracinaceae bacterium]